MAQTVYPDDPFSRPLHEVWPCMETLSGISIPGGTRYQRKQDFHENELRLVQGGTGSHVLWRFKKTRKKLEKEDKKSKRDKVEIELQKPQEPGTEVLAILQLQRTLRVLPETVVLEAKNAGRRPVQLRLWIDEIPWHPRAKEAFRTWKVTANQSIAPGKEASLVFPILEARPNSPCDREDPWVPARFQIEVMNVQDEVSYALHLKKWIVNYAGAQGVEVKHITVPSQLTAGETAIFQIGIQGFIPETPLDLEVRDREWVLWRIRLTQEERVSLAETKECVLSREIPFWMPSRDLTLGLVAGGRRVTGKEVPFSITNIKVADLPRMECRTHAGRPTVFLEGRPYTWCGYATYEFQPGNVQKFGVSQADLFVIPANAGRHVHEITEPTWLGPGQYDFGEIDQYACLALQSNPEAKLMIRVSLGLPAFWLMKHEAEWALVQTDKGNLPWEESGLPVASFASEAWREQQATNLRALIQHVRSQPWVDRVVGFIPTCGTTEEWFAWGCNNGYFSDYSRPGREKYRQWCLERGYPFFDMPSHLDRQHIGWDLFPASPEGQNAAVYALFQSDLAVETMEYFARVIKEETEHRSLVGIFHGYVIQLAGEARQHLAGHFALQRALRSPVLDLILGVPLHHYRNLGAGYDTYSTAIESVQMAGKVYVNENDLFSWLHQSPWTMEYSAQFPREAAIHMHQRVLANNMVHGVPGQWFSLFAHWHHDSLLQEAFAQMIRIQQQGLRFDRTGVEQIAFVVDDTSFAWFPPLSSLPKETNINLLYAFARTGAPVSTWLLSDLDQLPNRIGLVIIACATAAQPRDLEKLRSLLAKGGRTILLVGPAGLVDPNTLEWFPQAPATLTGLPIVVDYVSGSGVAQLSRSKITVCKLENLQPRARTSGQGFMVFDDKKVAGIERKLPQGGSLIWASVPPCNEGLAREWVEALGIHCYAPRHFTVHASKDLVSITAPSFGNFLLKWPRAVAVEDLFDGWKAQGVEFSCPFQGGQTRLFHVKAMD